MHFELHGRIVRTSLESRCLRGNVLGDPHVRDVYVYVPPGYDDGNRRYPAVMLLAGFGSTHLSMLRFDPWRPNLVQRFDRLLAAGRCPPALLVLPDAMTRWGGSQYVDSEATGRYQTYLADEVLDHVDREFRTIPTREARGVAGTSSGGFGALRLAMDHPERFAAVVSHAGDAAFEVSMRPELTTAAIAFERAGGLSAFATHIDEQGPRDQLDFVGVLVLAAASAYSPEPSAPFPHVALPFEPTTANLDPDVWARWSAHDPLERVAASAGALRRMALVHVDAGNRDEHGLQFAARSLAAAMRNAGIQVEHEEFEGGHRGTGWRYEHSLPRLIGALSGS